MSQEFTLATLCNEPRESESKTTVESWAIETILGEYIASKISVISAAYTGKYDSNKDEWASAIGAAFATKATRHTSSFHDGVSYKEFIQRQLASNQTVGRDNVDRSRTLFHFKSDFTALEESNRALLEIERLKTQLMAEKRAIIFARKAASNAEVRINELKAQNEKLLDAIYSLVKSKEALQSALIASSDGTLCMQETHYGIVNEASEEQVEVAYDTSSGVIKQSYTANQFFRGKLPREGNTIETNVFVIVKERHPKSDFISKLPLIGNNAVTGEIEL